MEINIFLMDIGLCGLLIIDEILAFYYKLLKYMLIMFLFKEMQNHFDF